MSNSKTPPDDRDGIWTRDRALVLVLITATALLLLVCGLLIHPFFGSISWAIALAVIAHPLHRWLAGRIGKPSLAAAIAVVVIAVVIVAPAIFVGHNVVTEAAKGVQAIQSGFDEGKLQDQFSKHSRFGSVYSSLDQQMNLSGQLHGFAKNLAQLIAKAAWGSVTVVLQLVLTLFVLFFLFRDRRKALEMMRSLVPLSGRETDQVFRRVGDTIHATIYGTVVVAMVQGTLGGLMFWWLGLPAPILWGAIMALLAIVPVMGAFVVWMPAAIFLGAGGEWGKAIILTAWGTVVIGLIDNMLFPVLVGKRMRMHTVPVFFGIVGGLALFGAAGLVLGPVALALTDAVLEIWRRRTTHGRTAEKGVGPSAS